MRIILLIIFLTGTLCSAFPSSGDVKALIAKAKHTNRSSDWNKVAEYYYFRRYEANQDNNYQNLLIEYAGEALTQAAEEKNFLELGNACMYFAEGSLPILGWDEYIEQYTSALEYYLKTKHILPRIHAASRLGNGYLAVGQTKAAHTCFEQALEWAERNQQEDGKSTLYLNFGKSYTQLGQFEKADHYLNLADKEAMSKFDGTNTDHIADIHYHKGNLSAKKKNYLLAMNSYDAALKISEKTGKDKTLRCLILNQIAVLYASWGKYEIAMEYTGRAMDICENLPGMIPLENLFNNHTALLCKNYKQITQDGQVREDMDILTFGVEMLTKFREWIQEDRRALFNNYIQTAILYDIYGTPESCDLYLEKAWKLTKDGDHVFAFNQYMKRKGSLSLKSGDYKAAIIFFETYLNTKMKDIDHFLFDITDYDVYAHLAECYERQNDPVKALYYKKKRTPTGKQP